jgi:hypothetical protein
MNGIYSSLYAKLLNILPNFKFYKIWSICSITNFLHAKNSFNNFDPKMLLQQDIFLIQANIEFWKNIHSTQTQKSQ